MFMQTQMDLGISTKTKQRVAKHVLNQLSAGNACIHKCSCSMHHMALPPETYNVDRSNTKPGYQGNIHVIHVFNVLNINNYNLRDSLCSCVRRHLGNHLSPP